jgi:uncharacterized protein (DUF2141 family)
MKKVLLTAVFIFSGMFCASAQEEIFDLTINISGLNSNKGTLLIAVYDQKEAFLKKQFIGNSVKIKNKKSMTTFKNLPKGEYAVSFFHDENGNKKMDTNFFGVPKEAYGCSNNAKGFMGPPKYVDAKFQLTANKIIEIKI